MNNMGNVPFLCHCGGSTFFDSSSVKTIVDHRPRHSISHILSYCSHTVPYSLSFTVHAHCIDDQMKGLHMNCSYHDLQDTTVCDPCILKVFPAWCVIV